MIGKFPIALSVLAAAVVAGGVSTASASAAIGQVSAKLSVSSGVRPDPIPHGSCGVTVYGNVRMTQAEAQGLINSGYHIVVRVWGEDPISDDLLLGPFTLFATTQPGATARITATPDGLTFGKQLMAVDRYILNEDSGPDPAGGDELYAGIRLVNAAGKIIRSGESNRVSGEFEFNQSHNC